jgi:hypothetical protein
MDLPENNDSDFDRDITENFGERFVTREMIFSEMRESFSAMMSSGFTETQALKFLAFCTIYDGDSF